VECSEAEPSDPLSWLSAVPFAAVMLAVASPAAGCLESGKVDPVPVRAEPAALVRSGRSAIYGTTFEYPAETRSVEVIILPRADRADGRCHLVGRSLALESYPLFSGVGAAVAIRSIGPIVSVELQHWLRNEKQIRARELGPGELRLSEPAVVQACLRCRETLTTLHVYS
jgi:hypothetical protein